MNTNINNKTVSTKVYLNVPYSRKDEAKNMGAKWDPDFKSWYMLENNRNFDKLTLLFPDIILIGEDRTFGGNQLFVDLIPKSCWFTNVRYCIAEDDWNRLRKIIYQRANNVCECCGELNGKWLEAHERWSYDDKNKIQKLERLIALCKDCHTSTHLGYAQIKGLGEYAVQHLQKVTGFNNKQLQEHIDRAFETWRERSVNEYTLDLRLITNSGIKLNFPIRNA
ncbi:DUF5710 domain-containing protein [Methylovulum psychrotolerans]|uniref:DUF5710 domain-containing protein n=1 Tax=Methylovulum psychrotolerans TaxID=1704499 RepID=A0A2S5CK28_9GAMM|nr:DUF5710 domain-containing protein [Methylovulum psychrotolerans]POZ51179.1 hypothetical protein AADEFJLK_03142 [Methylovulum psychrotolerans]